MGSSESPHLQGLKEWVYNNIGRCSDVSACFVVHDVRLYSVLDTVVISRENQYCSVVFALLLVCLG